ncbi:MAG: hypothetical protein JWM82_971 [Myxococcales bacterium]|nr:hypothetical protein [Myxococcales bacterium]
MRARSRVVIGELVVLLSATGCHGRALVAVEDGGSNAPDVGVAKRLVPWQLEAEGAPPLVVGIYDAQEKAHCRFVPDEAGQLRCLPWGLAVLQETRIFSEPTCQKAIYEIDPTREAIVPGRAVAMPLPRRSCEPRRYGVGTLKTLAMDAPLYSGSPCARFERPDTTTSTFVTVDEAQTPARWVTGTEVDGPLLSGRVRVRQIETVEGARFDQRLVDESIQKPCHLIGPPVAASPRCLPDVLYATEDGREGTDCSGPAVIRANACFAPAFIADYGLTTFNVVGTKWTGPVSAVAHGCGSVNQTTLDGPDIFYETGPVTPFQVAPLDLQTSGSGRLTLRGLRGEGDAFVGIDDEISAPAGWIAPRYADGTSQGCDPVWTPEGLVRCLPTGFIAATVPLDFVFSDPACQHPAFTCPSPASCDGVPVIFSSRDAHGETRPSALNAAKVVPGYQWKDHVCVPAADFPYAVFVPGAAIPWSTYLQLAELNGRASGAP